MYILFSVWNVLKNFAVNLLVFFNIYISHIAAKLCSGAQQHCMPAVMLHECYAWITLSLEIRKFSLECEKSYFSCAIKSTIGYGVLMPCVFYRILCIQSKPLGSDGAIKIRQGQKKHKAGEKNCEDIWIYFRVVAMFPWKIEFIKKWIILVWQAGRDMHNFSTSPQMLFLNISLLEDSITVQITTDQENCRLTCIWALNVC